MAFNHCLLGGGSAVALREHTATCQEIQDQAPSRSNIEKLSSLVSGQAYNTAVLQLLHTKTALAVQGSTAQLHLLISCLPRLTANYLHADATQPATGHLALLVLSLPFPVSPISRC